VTGRGLRGGVRSGSGPSARGHQNLGNTPPKFNYKINLRFSLKRVRPIGGCTTRLSVVLFGHCLPSQNAISEPLHCCSRALLTLPRLLSCRTQHPSLIPWWHLSMSLMLSARLLTNVVALLRVSSLVISTGNHATSSPASWGVSITTTRLWDTDPARSHLHIPTRSPAVKRNASRTRTSWSRSHWRRRGSRRRLCSEERYHS